VFVGRCWFASWRWHFTVGERWEVIDLLNEYFVSKTVENVALKSNIQYRLFSPEDAIMAKNWLNASTTKDSRYFQKSTLTAKPYPYRDILNSCLVWRGVVQRQRMQPVRVALARHVSLQYHIWHFPAKFTQRDIRREDSLRHFDVRSTDVEVLVFSSCLRCIKC
jgi:hypothetical protein